MADGLVPVVVSPVPFSRQIHDLTVREGATVLAMLVEAVRAGKLAAADLSRTTIYVDGERLKREEALETVLTAGQIINVVVEPLGGGGGGGKDIGQIVLTIAVIVASAWVGGPTGPLAAMSALVRTVASAAVMAVGQAAIGALFAPDRDAQAKANDRYALQSASNQYRPWSPFPMALGEVIVAPDLAVKTFTQSRGDDVWIYGILGLHYGACEVSEEKIGDTLASTMGPGDVQFVRHLTPGPRTFQLYPNDVDQLDLTEELQATTGSATPVMRAGSAEGEKFEFDFFLPQGLHFQKDDGRVLTASVTMTVRYRAVDEDGQPIGGGGWSNGLTIPLSSTTKEPWRVTRALTLPLGRYEFEIKRSTKPDNNEKRRDQVALTAIRSIAFRKPITDETLSIIEFAVRATALNQGTLAPITCRIKPVCQTWNAAAGAWSAPQATSNPAALTRWLLSGPAPVRPEAPERVDVGLRAWSELCETYDWTTNVYLTELKTQAEAMALLEQAGRASLFWDGTQIVASPWVEKPSPVQMFAGDNLRDHKWTMAYVEPVHALRVEFQNLDQGGEPDELYVYADGYAETAGGGKEAAVLIEALRIEGQRTEERAYRDGRWELGRRLHQRRVDTWACDIEQLASRYGSRVRLAWQRVDSGASARVRVRRWSGSLVSGLRLTQPVTMLPGESYAVDLRLVDGVDAAVPIINAATSEPVTTRDITFASPRAESAAPRGGDLVAFGIATRVSEDVEIIGIEPGEGLTATLTGIRYVAPLLMAGETGPIPELQTRLSRHRAASPPAPRLLGVQPDPSGVRVSFDMPPWTGSPIIGYSARWRPTPPPGLESGWLSLPALDAGALTLITPPPRALPVPVDQDDETLIDIEIRAITAAGQTSPDPLLIEALAVRDTPFMPTNVSVTAATRTAPDGSSHGVLVFSADPLDAAVSTDMIVEVRRYDPTSGLPDDWEAAGLILPANNPVGDILGLRAATAYGTRAAWRTAGGWYSDWTAEIVRTVPAGSNVSGDVAPIIPANVAGTPSIAITTTISPDGTVTSRLWGDWADASNAAAYLVELSDGTSSVMLDVPTSDLADLIVRIGGTYRYRVKGRSRTGHLSNAWSSWSANQAASGDATAPGPVGVVGGSGNGVFPLVRQIGMAWANPTASDLARVLIYRNTSGTGPNLTGEAPYGWSEGTRFFDGQATLGITYYYWALTQDRSGNTSWNSLVYLGSGQARRVSVSADDVLATDPLLVTGYGIASGIAGQGPGATAPANRVLNDRVENGVNFVSQPDGGTLAFEGSTTGAVQIVLPYGSTSSAMIKFDVFISDLSAGRMNTKYTLSGYLTVNQGELVGTQGWGQPFATMIGPRGATLRVRFGYYGGKGYIWIGEPNTTWYYPSVRVENLEVRYSGASLDWSGGWNVSFNSGDVSSITAFSQIPRPGDAVFGEGVLEAPGGAVATRANFRTDQGISQGIAGQGALATRATVDDGYISGSLAHRVAPHPTYGANYLDADRMLYGNSYSVDQLRPGEAGANVTEGRISSGIAGQGPGATAPEARVMNDRIEANVQTVLRPQGGSLGIAGTTVGRIQIRLPVAYEGLPPSGMVNFSIRLYNLGFGDEGVVYTVGGYLYGPPYNVWYNPQASYVGPRGRALPVHFGYENGRYYVWIGNANTDWYYLGASVENLLVFNTPDTRWTRNWEVTIYPGNIAPLVGTIIQVPRAGDQVFGEGLYEAPGGALATRANFRTDQGIANGIAGQSAWATHQVSVNRIQYIDDTGRLIDGRGLPLNAASGAGIVLDPPAPLSPGGSPSTQIAIAATSVTLVGGQVISIAASTISGLSADTTYAVFYDLLTSSCTAISSGYTSYFTSANRYLAIGYQRTSLAGGGYSPPPPPPPGGGGGIGNCADEDSLILMANADRTGPGDEKRFGDLKAGDWVWTQHEVTESWGAFEVEAVNFAPGEPCCLLTLFDGRSLAVTADHRLRVEALGFVHAKDLAFGAPVLGPQPSRLRERVYAGRRTVVKATIRDAHTYVANGMLSHNIKMDYQEP